MSLAAVKPPGTVGRPIKIRTNAFKVNIGANVPSQFYHVR